jgi:hypothetical protein
LGILEFKAIDDSISQSKSNRDIKGLGPSEKSYVPNELGDVLDALAAFLGPVAKSLAAEEPGRHLDLGKNGWLVRYT